MPTRRRSVSKRTMPSSSVCRTYTHTHARGGDARRKEKVRPSCSSRSSRAAPLTGPSQRERLPHLCHSRGPPPLFALPAAAALSQYTPPTERGGRRLTRPPASSPPQLAQPAIRPSARSSSRVACPAARPELHLSNSPPRPPQHPAQHIANSLQCTADSSSPDTRQLESGP